MKPPTSLREVMLLGFNHSSRRQRNTMIANTICCGAVFLLYFFLNGGIIPWFLVDPSKPAAVSSHPSTDLVNGFPETNGDGSRVVWSHAANTKEKLLAAIQDERIMMLEGDVMLENQGTAQQKLRAVMADNHKEAKNAPMGFKEWLSMALKSQKGIKIDFKTVEPLEVSLQTLQARSDQIKAPLLVGANILSGPNWQDSNMISVDSLRFFRLTDHYFPHGRIAVGWVTGEGPERQYTWQQVKRMHDILHHRVNRHQPVAFVVQAPFVKNSLGQLKWIIEMYNAPLIITACSNDRVPSNDFHVIRQMLPKHMVHYDMHARAQDLFATDTHDLASLMKDLQEAREVFDTSRWESVRDDATGIVFSQSQAVVMKHAMMITKENVYKTLTAQTLTVRGHVEFVDIPKSTAQRQPLQLVVNLHSATDTDLDNTQGLQCIFTYLGQVIIKRTTPVVSTVLNVHNFPEMENVIGCYHFIIEDDLSKKSLKVKVVRPAKDCLDTEGQVVEMTASYDDKATTRHGHIAVIAGAKHGFVVIDKLIME